MPILTFPLSFSRSISLFATVVFPEPGKPVNSIIKALVSQTLQFFFDRQPEFYVLNELIQHAFLLADHYFQNKKSFQFHFLMRNC